MGTSRLVVCGFLLFCAACASGSAQEGDDAGFGVESHPCNENTLLSDFWNCGECGMICPSADADRCIWGECVCGGEAECGAGRDCRYGRCMQADPNGAVCEFDEECGREQGCLEGKCSPLDCRDEICNGADDDCDGEIDEVAPGAPLNEACFNGHFGNDVGDVLPPCQPGTRVCFEGIWSQCLFEVLPQSEAQGLFACDGIDNDCDGCIDGDVGGEECRDINTWGFDIVFVVDISGSMQGTISAVRDAVHNFAAHYSRNEEFKFGIILLASRQYQYPQRPYLYLDLADFELFETMLMSIDMDGDGQEPQWDAIYELGTGELPMNWRANSTRIIILFSDEEGQTYRQLFELPSVRESDMCDALTHGEVLAVIELPLYFSYFNDCAAYLFGLSDDSKIMTSNLQSIITDPCE